MNQSKLQLPAAAIVDSVREPLLLIDEKLRVIKTNPSFDRLFEVKSEEAVGRPLPELGNGQWDIPSLKALLDRLLTRKESFDDFEVDHDFPTIGRRVMLLNARLVRQSPDRAPLVLLALEDVTERRRAEALLAAHSAALERSNRDLEEFAYVASHDLQEPLRMVVSYTQLLSNRYKGKLDQDADDFIGFAVDGAKRMQKLIGDLLAYSRLDRPAPSAEPSDSGRALADALAALSTALDESGGKVVAEALPSVDVDYGQLVQLFQNLIGNACKFKSDRPLVVRVAAVRDGAMWSFRVEDNGIGIDPRHFERVFIIFERLHGAETPGSGIGLALCRKIVQRHGGRIWIEAVPDGGAAFRFTLPAFKGARP